MVSPLSSGTFWDRLLVKQAVATLSIAIVMGAVTNLWELAGEWKVERAAIVRVMNEELLLVKGTASEAAFQLSSDIASEVVQGLVRNPAVIEVNLSDNFGNILGHSVRTPDSIPLADIAASMMSDILDYQLPLEAKGLDQQISKVGTLTVRLDSAELTEVFLVRVKNDFWLGMLRALLISALVVAVFHRLITRPILSITRDIASVDPLRPAAFPVSVPSGHEGDELGALAKTVQSLLNTFQQGLNQRDKAEEELSALARDLERRVAERTADLERAHQSIKDGIRYAARLQGALLPSHDALNGIVDDWAVGWHPLDQVGGDFYWAGAFGDKGVIAVMDCTGHGVPGAFMSAVASSALGRVLHHLGHEDPAQILSGINLLVKTALHQENADAHHSRSNDGLDAAICVIDPQKKQVKFAGAGLSLVARIAGGQQTIKGDKISLGYAESPSDHSFQTQIIDYVPGDTFILFTDGVIDQVGGPQRRLLGRRRLETILAECRDKPLADQLALLQDRLSDWRGTEHLRDDMTVLAFRPS
jgi:serine phosphatase RsbU (regulator of sigma subunit)